MCVIRMANGHTHVDDVERFLSAFDNRTWLKSIPTSFVLFNFRLLKQTSGTSQKQKTMEETFDFQLDIKQMCKSVYSNTAPNTKCSCLASYSLLRRVCAILTWILNSSETLFLLYNLICAIAKRAARLHDICIRSPV